MENEYIFKRINAENLKDLQVLIKDIYNRDDSLERIQHKYDTINWGKDYIGYFAYTHKGDVAAYYGVFPIEFQYKGQTILAAQSGDTMTHSNHRRKGLFVQLAKKTYQLAKDEGIQFVFGFPNENSYPGFQRKLGWKFYEKMKSYNFFIITLPISFFVQKISNKGIRKLVSSYSLKIISMFSTKNELFVNSYNYEDDIYFITKDKRYFNYKNDKNKFIISTNALKVWIKYDGSLSVGDISFKRDLDFEVKKKSFNQLIRKLKLIAFLSGIIRIRFYVSPDCKIDKLLKGKGYCKDSLYVGLLDFTNTIDIKKLKFTFSDYDTF